MKTHLEGEHEIRRFVGFLLFGILRTGRSQRCAPSLDMLNQLDEAFVDFGALPGYYSIFSERIHPRHTLPDDQRVNVVRALVRLHRFQIHHVAH